MNRVSEWFKDDEENNTINLDLPEKDDTLAEDEMLMDLGISLDLAKQFRSHYGNKKIYYGGKLTKQFFEWILKSCNKDQLWLIQSERAKYSKEFQKMIDEATPMHLGEETPVWNKDVMEIKSELGYLKQYVRFLYDLLGRMNETAGYVFNDEEFKMIEKIDGVLRK